MIAIRAGYLIPLGLGIVAAAGQAPVSLPAVMVVALAAALYLWADMPTSGASARFGFLFGFGYFVVCLHWIVSPFLVDAARHGWMAPFALVLMAAGGAAFWMVAFWLARLWGQRTTGHLWIVVTLPAVELVRAYIFTGFPWATPAQATVDSMFGQALAILGPHGMNLALVVFAALIAKAARRSFYFGGALAVGVTLQLIVPAVPQDVPLSGTVLRLVQPNAPQADKWDPDKAEVFFARQLDFTQAAPDPEIGPPDAIVWPETAIPWNLNYAAPLLRDISIAARGVPVILGAQRTEGERHYNALVVLDASGDVAQTYDKHHLVPFGEYVPFGDLAARFGIYGLAPQHGAGFTAGPGPTLLDLGPVGRALPLICYEAVFAHDVGAAPERPDFIIHATNDAWFGALAGPQQHLAQARMRAIEQGLSVARAANTGISAMIDPRGRILQALDMGQAGYIDAPLPQALPPTFYSRTGDAPALSFLLLLAMVLRLHGWRRARAE